MTIAHRWNSGEQTIPMRYGTKVGELIRRSSALETPAYLALEASCSLLTQSRSVYTPDVTNRLVYG